MESFIWNVLDVLMQTTDPIRIISQPFRLGVDFVNVAGAMLCFKALIKRINATLSFYDIFLPVH